VVDDELGDDADVALMRLGDEAAELAHRAVGRIDGAVVGDVIAVVAERRGVERQQPDSGDAEVVDVIQAIDKACEVADAVIIGVLERLDVQLIDYGILVPMRIGPIDNGSPSANFA
jgi:hypothetical protein